jgi:hypothetical protein
MRRGILLASRFRAELAPCLRNLSIADTSIHMERGLHGVFRWAAIIGGMAGTMLLLLLARPMLQSPRGALGPTILQAASPAMAAAVFVVGFILACAVAAIVGRFTNSVVGLFTLGWGLTVLTLGLESIEELAFTPAASPLMVSIETLLLSILLCIAAVIVFRVAGPLPDMLPRHGAHEPDGAFSAPALQASLAGLAVVPVVWLLAQSPLKGQAYMAVFVGAMLAGLLGRLMAPHAAPLLLFVTPCVFGGLAQLAAAVMLKQPLDQSHVSGTIPHVLLPMPLDVAAGTLAGTAFGLGWARSFIHQQDEAKSTNDAPAVS